MFYQVYKVLHLGAKSSFLPSSVGLPQWMLVMLNITEQLLLICITLGENLTPRDDWFDFYLTLSLATTTHPWSLKPDIPSSKLACCKTAKYSDHCCQLPQLYNPQYIRYWFPWLVWSSYPTYLIGHVICIQWLVNQHLSMNTIPQVRRMKCNHLLYPWIPMTCPNALENPLHIYLICLVSRHLKVRWKALEWHHRSLWWIFIHSSPVH